MHQKNRKLKQFVISTHLVVIGIIIGLLIIEVILRIFGIGYGNAPLISDHVFHHIHPQSYSFKSHDPCHEYGGHDVFYDQDGLVSFTTNFQTTRKHTKKIALLGDSFTEATQVAYAESFAGIIQNERKELLVKNYGVSSYSPIFYSLLWERKVKFFKPDIVIMQLYSNDISSDETYQKIAVFSNDGQIQAIPGPPQNKIIIFLRKFYLARFIRKVQLQLYWYSSHEKQDDTRVISGYIEENPDLSQLTKGLILQCKQNVEHSGAKFYLFVIPSKYRLMKGALSKRSMQFNEFSDKVKNGPFSKILILLI